MDLWDGDCGVHGLSKVVLEEVGVSSSHGSFVVGVELYVDDLLVVGAGYGDGGGEAEFHRGVDGGEYGIRMVVFHGDDVACELRGRIFSKV